jgi:putative copper resistance protein D
VTETVDAGLVAIRFATFVLAILNFGGACFALYAPAGRSLASGPALRLLAPAGLALAALGYLVLLGREASGTAGLPTLQVVSELVEATGFGRALAVTVAAAALLAAFGIVAGRWARTVLAGAALAALAFVGHGADGEGLERATKLGLMGLHLMAVGAWLGALPRLWQALADRGPAALQLLARFGRVGGIAVALVVASGLGTLGFIWAGVGGKLGPDYLSALLVKLGLVAGLFALAALNRFRLTPLANREPDRALPALRRSIVLEQAMGIAAIASVALLGQLDPSM